MGRLKLKNRVDYKKILYIIFFIYFLILIKIILFKTNSFVDLLKGNTSAGYRSTNLIPFKTIVNFFNIEGFSFLRAFSNTIGNIAVFLPLGYLLPLLTKKVNNIYKILCITVSISIVFESLQYIFYLGSLDIDDVILNTLGGAIGYTIYFYINKFTNSDKSMFKISLILSVIAFMIGFPIAKNEFGNLLGITSEETLYINKDAIPNEDPKIRGTYISTEEDCLKIYDSIISKNSQEKEFLKEKIIPIDKNTKFYYSKIKQLKNKSQIEYVPVTIDELDKIKEYSLMSIWEIKNNKIILFSDGIDSNTKISKAKSGDSKNSVNEKLSLSGDIKDISKNMVKINIAIQKDMGNGKTISTIGKDESANFINIIINDKTNFKLKEEGKNEKNIKWTDAKPGDSVRITYIKNKDEFLAENITILKGN